MGAISLLFLTERFGFGKVNISPVFRLVQRLMTHSVLDLSIGYATLRPIIRLNVS